MEDQSYCNLFSQYLELVQKFEPKTKPVHLRFAPLGTNALFLADELCRNVNRGYGTKIVPGHYAHDQHCLDAYNQKHDTEHTLQPWVLQRYDDHHQHPRPWEIWFRPLEESEAAPGNYRSRKQELQNNLKKFKTLNDRHALELGICLDYVTRFNSETLDFVQKHDQIKDCDVIAVHIRRGDACSEDLERADPNRDNFHLCEYIARIENYRTQGYKNFYILTESQSEIDRLRSRFEGSCNILYSSLDRENFIQIPKSEFNAKYFVEYQSLENPAFAKFLMESALIDIHNARRCVGFIGTFSSQFSVTNWLKMTGYHRRRIPHQNLSPVPFTSHFAPIREWSLVNLRMHLRLRTRIRSLLFRFQMLFAKTGLQSGLVQKFKDHKSASGKPAVLVLRERDVGFFSLFLQVLNTLLIIEEENLNCSVYVELGKNQAYFHNSNTWLDFFEPISGQETTPSHRQLERVEADYQNKLNHAVFWDPQGFVYSTEKGVYWTASFYPKLTPNSRARTISHHTVPTKSERIRAAKIVRTYLLPNADVRAELQAFVKDNAITGHIIGVQFRGTDARTDGRRVIPAYEIFIEAIRDQLQGRSDHPVIVVASDEQAFIDAIASTFPNVKSYQTLRHQSGTLFDGEGPQGFMMPKFVTDHKNAALKGAIMDYLIISMSHVLIHNLGSVSNTALLTNPAIKSIRIGHNIL